jgi:hypothetical protein
MARRKEFGAGVDAILGGKKYESKEQNFPKDFKEVKVNKKKVNKGIKTCLQIDEELLSEFKAIAHWERMSQRELIEIMIQQYSKTKGENFVENAKKNYPQNVSC